MVDINDDRWRSFTGGYVLHWMDLESQYYLGAAGDIWCISGSRRIIDISAGELAGYSDGMVADDELESKLYYRLLCRQFELGYCGQLLFSIRSRSRISLVCFANGMSHPIFAVIALRIIVS